ncbi:MAG: hypothetical protein ACTSR8_13700 [Promethearchaeota archaeon]
MFSTVAENTFFSQKVQIKKKFTNREIKLYQYFFKKTRVFPSNIIIHNTYILFFVDSKYYFRAKAHLKTLRKELMNNKVLIIRSERILIKLLFGFFPDTYIHDIIMEYNEELAKKIVHIQFLSYKERGIAIGGKGNYIKTVNEIFEKHIIFEKNFYPIQIQCEVVNL